MSKSIGLAQTIKSYPKDASCISCHWKLDTDDKYLFCRNYECKKYGILTLGYCFDNKEIESEIL